MIVVTAIAAGLAVVASPAQAHHRDNAYCNPTGDLCQSTAKVDGVRRLQIRTFDRLFARYKVCVTAPDDSRTCRRFRMRDAGEDSWASSIRWSRHFPYRGEGAYTVRWRVQGAKIGESLGFHS